MTDYKQSEISERIGQNIQSRRKAIGMSQKDLASAYTAASGQPIHESYISAWENGTRKMSAMQAIYVASALGCSIDHLLVGEPEAKSEHDSRLFTEIASLADTERETLYHAAVKWNGDNHALIQFIAMYLSLPAKYRVDVAGMLIFQHERAKADGKLLDSGLYADLDFVEASWERIAAPKDRAERQLI